MPVRAKFKVRSVIHHEQRGEVNLDAVTTGSEENKTFWKYTPAGTINMQIDNEAAMKQFSPGAEFYVDFTEALKE